MKPVLCFMLLSVCCIFSGCVASTPPFAMDDGISRKMITRCDNDIFCFRKPLYDVAWDAWCQRDCGDRDRGNAAYYPVSYRSNEYIYANDPNGYAVTLPAGGNTYGSKKAQKGDVHE